MQQGKYAARVIQDRLRKSHEQAVPLFQQSEAWPSSGAAPVSPILALFVSTESSRGYYGCSSTLMYLVQFRNRLIVFIRWGFQYITFDRGARLITTSDNNKT